MYLGGGDQVVVDLVPVYQWIFEMNPLILFAYRARCRIWRLNSANLITLANPRSVIHMGAMLPLLHSIMPENRDCPSGCLRP